MNEVGDASVTSVPTKAGPLRVSTPGAGPHAVLWHSLLAP